MRYKKLIPAKEANLLVKRPLKLQGALRFFNRMIIQASLSGCYELYMSPNYENIIKKKRYYYKLDDRETSIVFDWVKMDYYELQLQKNGYYVDYDWIRQIFIIKWRL